MPDIQVDILKRPYNKSLELGDVKMVNRNSLWILFKAMGLYELEKRAKDFNI